MKRRQLWMAAVGMFFVIFLMNASGAFAADARDMSTYEKSANVSQWAYGTPIILGESSRFTGNEAMVTMTGTVKKIEPMRGVKDGVEMQFIAEEGGKWVVYMGPKWLIDNQNIKLKANDKVEVRGKKYGGAIIATEISKGEWTMKLRNEEDGQAVWQCCFPYKEKKN
jgi:hypothetical protein